MAKKPTKSSARALVDRVLVLCGVVATVVLFAIGGLAWWASSFITTQVHDQLTAQKIYFPPKGSPALDPTEFPTLQQYGGQIVDNAPKAKAYADEYIAAHLEKVANGKTYAEVSSEARANPTNQSLQQQKTTLFQGETLRGLLLGNAYAFGTIGDIAGAAAVVAFAAGVTMLILVVLGWRHLRSVA